MLEICLPKVMQLSQSLTKSEKVPLSLIVIFWPFWQCCKKVYLFNCHVGCMSTQSDTFIKSIRPLYHIDKRGRPFSILTGKMGRPNSNIAKKCVFWGRHKDTFMKSIRPLYHINKKGRPYSTSTGKMGRPNSNIPKKCVFWG